MVEFTFHTKFMSSNPLEWRFLKTFMVIINILLINVIAKSFSITCHFGDHTMTYICFILMDFFHCLKQKNEIEKSKEYNCGYGLSKRSPAANYSPLQQAASARTKQPGKGKASRDTIAAAKGINAGTKLRQYITKYVLI